MKYGKGTNKGTLKVRCCHSKGTLCTIVLVPYYATLLYTKREQVQNLVKANLEVPFHGEPENMLFEGISIAVDFLAPSRKIRKER